MQIDTDHGGEFIDSPAQLERYRLVLDRMEAAALPPESPGTTSCGSPATSEGPKVPDLRWQKSSYSQEASSCVYVAAAPDGTIHLRESDNPDVILPQPAIPYAP